MVEHVFSDDEITIFIDQSRFRALPDRLRALVDGKARFVEVDGGSALRINDMAAARAFLEAVVRIEKNRSRRAHRMELEYTIAGGRHESQDLARIFEIQDGRCYFTGDPLVWSPRNWSLDHLKPVCDGGSFWPENLAVVLKEINQHKHDRSKQQYWNLLEKTRGKAWVAARKEICREIDKARRELDRKRRAAVLAELDAVGKALRERHPSGDVTLTLERDDRLDGLGRECGGVPSTGVHPEARLSKRGLLC